MAGRRREGQQPLVPPQPPPKALELLSLLAHKPQLSNPACLQHSAERVATKHVCRASPNLAGGLEQGGGQRRESPPASPEGLRTARTAVTKAEGAATPRRCCWAGKVRTVTWAQHLCSLPFGSAGGQPGPQA